MIKKYSLHILKPLLLAISCTFLQCRPHHGDSETKRKDKTSNRSYSPEEAEYPGFNRDADHIIYSRHARCRMACRHIDENDVKEILHKGKINTAKIETDSRGTSYPLEGQSHGHHLRIVFAPKKNDAVEVVTCIDLDREWPCSCD